MISVLTAFVLILNVAKIAIYASDQTVDLMIGMYTSSSKITPKHTYIQKLINTYKTHHTVYNLLHVHAYQ